MKTKQFLNFIFLLTVVFLLNCKNLFATVNYEEFMWEKTIITPAQFQNEYWLEFWFLPNNPKYGFACSMNGAFAKTNDSGKTWRAGLVSLGFHAESIHFVDTNIGFVSGTSTIFRTVDGGENWENLTGAFERPGFSRIWGHFLLDANNIWMVAGNCATNGGNQVFYKSTDTGNSWTYFDTVVANTSLTDIVMFERNGLGYAIGSGYLWRTQNGGNSWQILNETPIIYWQNTPPTRHNWHEDIAISNRSVLIPMSPGCHGSSGGRNQGALGFSTNLGTTWNTLMTNGSMFGTFLLNDSTGFGCGYNHEVYFTRNYGRDWTKIVCGIPAGTDLDDLWFINDTVGFVGGNGGIWRLVRRDFDITVLGDSLKCKNDSVKLTVDKNFNYYEWFEIRENGDTVLIDVGKNVVVGEGKYFVRGHIFNCDSVDSKIFEVGIFPTLPIEIKTNGNFCLGDTVKIWTEKPDSISNFYWKINSENFENLDTVIFENIQENSLEILFVYENFFGCLDTVNYNLNISNRIKPILSGNSSFCVNLSTVIKLVNSNVFTENIWFKDDVEIARNISEITATEAGKYSVVASINQLCADSSEIFEIVVRDEFDVLDFSANEIPFFVDSVNFGKQGNNYLKVKNNGSQTFILEQIYFAKKFAFTAPMSQFPLKILPNETKEILIFYTPTNIDEQFDTIYFVDNCSIREIPLSGFGKRNSDNSLTVCDVEVRVVTHSIQQKRIFTVGNLIPNPVGTSAKISFVGHMQYAPTVQIYDVIGNEIETNFVVSEEENFGNGEIIIDTENLKSGIYFLRINLEGTNYLRIFVK